MQPPDGSISAPPELLQGFFSEACKPLWVRNKGMNAHASENRLIQVSFDGSDGSDNAPAGDYSADMASGAGAVVSRCVSDGSQPLEPRIGLKLGSVSLLRLQAAMGEQDSESSDSCTTAKLLARSPQAPEIGPEGESANGDWPSRTWHAPIPPGDLTESANRSCLAGPEGASVDSGRGGSGAAVEARSGEDSDEQLVLRVQFGDEEALALLRGRYGGLLQSQALRVLRSREEADDAVSEVFIEVWQRASCYHSERARPVAWLVTLVRRRAIDRLRVQQRQRKIELGLCEKQMYLMPDGASPVEEEMRLAEIRSALESAINKLPAEQGRAVWMAYCKGFSQKEISKITKAPVGTVKTRLEIGLRKMRQRLAQDESILNALRSGRLGKAPPPGQKAGAERVLLDRKSSGEEAKGGGL